MQLPRWVLLVVAAFVMSWGFFRIKLGLRSNEADENARQKGGLYGMPRRTHLLMGVICVLASVLLILTAFGIRFF